MECSIAHAVSILTRPEGRVQRWQCWVMWEAVGFNPHPSRRTGATQLRRARRTLAPVSILTRPEGRVQRDGPAKQVSGPGFNPHPSRRTGATGIMNELVPMHSFNPHPSRRTGATRGQGASVCIALRFNPHPSRRTGATRTEWQASQRGSRFQSSPVPKDGCNEHHPQRRLVGLVVSILTRPEGRVQRTNAKSAWVDIPCFNPHPSRRTGATWQTPTTPPRSSCFNPHPSRRTGATGHASRIAVSERCFNPHPSRRTGATIAGEGWRNQILGVFQSSPVPKDGCNWARLFSALCWAMRFQSSPVPKDGCNWRCPPVPSEP